jgi:chromosomal replication initiator protein
MNKMQNEITELLTKAKELLKEEVTTISYETWIKGLEIQSIDNEKINLLVSNNFKKDVLQSKYNDLLTNTFNYLTGKDCIISVFCPEDLVNNTQNGIRGRVYAN